MTGFGPANGALMTADQHRAVRRETADQLQQYVHGLDAVERLRMMSLARDYYRDNVASMVHTIVVAGGDLVDIAWLTQDSVDRVRSAWVEWARLQIDVDEDFDVEVYRRVADVLGVWDELESALEKLRVFARANGLDFTSGNGTGDNDTNGTHSN